MSSRRAAPPARSRARAARPESPRGRASGDGSGSESPLVAVGHILLGLSLSCLMAMVLFVALIGVAAAVVYLSR